MSCIISYHYFSYFHLYYKSMCVEMNEYGLDLKKKILAVIDQQSKDSLINVIHTKIYSY